MKLQVLVATMNQKDFALADRMNIHCDAIIANQADCEKIENKATEFGNLKMITTSTRGVGLNRNIALLASEADILLLADDDMVYNDDMPQAVTEAFDKNADADVIIFGADIVKNGVVAEKRVDRDRRLHVWNAMRYGTYRIAVKRKAILENNITFNQCFGGGCAFSAGEDSLFLKSCFDSGLKVYSHHYVLGTCCKDTSTWFKGYNEKYFYDKGILVRNLFPRCAYLAALYFGVVFKRETEIGLLRRLHLVYSGVFAGKKMIPYERKNEKDHNSK